MSNRETSIRPLIHLFGRAWPFFALLAALLLLRATSDHRSNFHYTGENTGEHDLQIAAENFRRFGYIATRFTPIPDEVLTNPHVDLRQPVLYYTHYGPLPYLLYSLPHTVIPGGEFVARCIAILISMVGLFFALASVYEWTGAFIPSETVPVLLPLVLLSLNPVILCFSDTIYEEPMTEALKWVGLFWAVRSLRRSVDDPPLSLVPGISILFLLIFISNEWLVPMAVVIFFVLWMTQGSPARSPRIWAVTLLLGYVLPSVLRVGQVCWIFHGLSPALENWRNIALTRSAGNANFPYSFSKHLVKLFFGIFWFAGPVILLTVAIGVLPLLRKLFSLSDRSPDKRQLMWLMAIWAAGSISWQFFMRQHAMIHGFTYIHPANFLIWIAAAGVIILWVEGRTALAASLVAAQIFLGGMITKSEIIIPYLRSHVIAEVSHLSPDQREKLLADAAHMHSSMASEIVSTLAAAPAEVPSRQERKYSALWLHLLMYIFKSSSINGPI